MPRLETICMQFLNDVHLHLTFLSTLFKCPMLSADFIFSHYATLMHVNKQMQ